MNAFGNSNYFPNPAGEIESAALAGYKIDPGLVFILIVWEDGSYRLSNGNTGCFSWGICD
jgi:hypothetical protein